MAFRRQTADDTQYRFISFVDVIFILLIFFIAESIMVFGGSERQYKEATVRVPLIRIEDVGPTSVQNSIESNFLIYIYERDGRTRYILLNKGENLPIRNYDFLIKNKDFPSILTRAEVRVSRQELLTLEDVTVRLRDYKDYIKKKQGKYAQPIVTILAPKDLPYFEVVRLYTFCRIDLGLHSVYLNTAQSIDDLFRKVQPVI